MRVMRFELVAAFVATACFLMFTLPSAAQSPGGKEVKESASIFKGAGPHERRHVEVSFDNMDVYPLLDYLLGEVLEVNFVVDPAIRGTVSLKVTGDYSRDELFDIFNSALQLHGITIVPADHGLYKVVRKPTGAAAGTTLVQGMAGSPRPGDVIRVIQLKYLSAAYVVNNLKTFLNPGAVMVPEPSINAIFLVDTGENAKKIGKIVSLMDTSFFKEVHWRIFNLENTDVSDIENDLMAIFKDKGLYDRPGMDKSGLQIVPLKTINSILVMTRWEEFLDVAGHWIEELDKGHYDKGVQVHVYFVQNGKAKDIADLLKQIYTEGSQGTGSSGNKQVLVKREAATKGKTGKKPGAKNALSGELAGEVEVIADEVNNALIIKAGARDYAIISNVLKELDVVPRQVLIDVLILEVTLNDKVEYGVEWFIKNQGISINGAPYSGEIVLNGGDVVAQGAGFANGIQGLSYSLFNSAGDLRAFLKALGEKTDVNILSAPNILALDNQESSIEAGDDVPTLTGTTTTTGGTVTQSVQYRNAGIILKVKPSINDNGLVRMEVSQEVSKVFDETTGGIDSPRFTTRKASTNLVARDGQTVLIGGLMQTQKERTTVGIPFLKDLPLLGYLFGSKKFKTQKTELLIAITPHVVKSREDADSITREFMGKVKTLKGLLGQQGLIGMEETLNQDEEGAHETSTP